MSRKRATFWGDIVETNAITLRPAPPDTDTTTLLTVQNSAGDPTGRITGAGNVVFGVSNVNQGLSGTLVTGQNTNVYASNAAVIGGDNQVLGALASNSTILGGTSNWINGSDNVILGGTSNYQNLVQKSTIAGGVSNQGLVWGSLNLGGCTHGVVGDCTTMVYNLTAYASSGIGTYTLYPDYPTNLKSPQVPLNSQGTLLIMGSASSLSLVRGTNSYQFQTFNTQTGASGFIGGNTVNTGTGVYGYFGVSTGGTVEDGHRMTITVTTTTANPVRIQATVIVSPCGIN